MTKQHESKDVRTGRDATATRLAPWTPPTLRELGSVAAHTNAIDVSGRNDGGGGTMKRT